MLDQIRRGDLAGARQTAGSITTASLSEGVVDPVAVQAKADAEKKSKFDAAVKAGNIKDAVKYRTEGQTPQDAALQYQSDRAKLFEQAKLKPGSIDGLGTEVAPGLKVFEEDVFGGRVKPQAFAKGGMAYKGQMQIGTIEINIENKGEPLKETVAGGFRKALEGVDVSNLSTSYAGAEQ
jgi:hypothetical protein